MMQVLFDYPLPNNGDRYDLSEQELYKLLEQAYNNGYNTAKIVYDTNYTKTNAIGRNVNNDEQTSDWR